MGTMRRLRCHKKCSREKCCFPLAAALFSPCFDSAVAKRRLHFLLRRCFPLASAPALFASCFGSAVARSAASAALFAPALLSSCFGSAVAKGVAFGCTLCSVVVSFPLMFSLGPLWGFSFRHLVLCWVFFFVSLLRFHFFSFLLINYDTAIMDLALLLVHGFSN